MKACLQIDEMIHMQVAASPFVQFFLGGRSRSYMMHGVVNNHNSIIEVKT